MERFDEIVLIGYKQATIVQDLCFLIKKNVVGSLTILDPDEFLNPGSSRNPAYLVVVTRDMSLREKVSRKLDAEEFKRFTYIDPTSVVSNTAEINSGSIVLPYSSVFSGAVLGKDCMISPYSMVSHKSILGQGVIMQPYSIVAGSSSVGSWSRMNVRSTVLDHIDVVEYCEIGASSTVTKNIIESGRYLGSPARKWKKTHNDSTPPLHIS